MLRGLQHSADQAVPEVHSLILNRYRRTIKCLRTLRASTWIGRPSNSPVPAHCPVQRLLQRRRPDSEVLPTHTRGSRQSIDDWCLGPDTTTLQPPIGGLTLPQSDSSGIAHFADRPCQAVAISRLLEWERERVRGGGLQCWLEGPWPGPDGLGHNLPAQGQSD